MKALERLRRVVCREETFSWSLNGIADEIASEFKHEQELRDSALKELEEARAECASLKERLENSVERPAHRVGDTVRCVALDGFNGGFVQWDDVLKALQMVERTCEVMASKENSVPIMACSLCGHELSKGWYFDKEGNDTLRYPKYCAECGARVKEAE